jgi:acyl carrier protein
MKKQEITSKLKDLIAYELDINIKREEIADDSPLLEGGIGLDSISIVNLIVLIEKNFNIRFQDEEITMDLFSDLNTLSSFIESKYAGVSQ